MSGLHAREGNNIIFATILSEDGSIRVKAKEGAPKAVERKWTMNERSGVKWEYKYDDLSGMIHKVFVKENQFENGSVKVLNINVKADDDIISLQTPLSSNFASDFLKRLPNVDFSKPVKLIPYSFLTEEGKKKKGIAVHQGEVKHVNFFFDPDTKMNQHGFPDIDETEKYEDWYWKAYFGKVASFLSQYLENVVAPKIEAANVMEAPEYAEATEADIAKEFANDAPEDLPIMNEAPAGIPEENMLPDDDLPF